MKSILAFSFVFLLVNVYGQTQQDTIYTYYTSTPVVVDGADDDACWQNERWFAIDQVWLPFGATMADGDFEGRFKVAWDEDYLYLLVEVVDDMISDGHADPLQNWWDDDCLEIFIDEDRSKGWHERSCNAFAYHVSITYDAIDLGSDGSGINYKDHLDVYMQDIGDNTYIWELAIKIYGDDYDHANPEASRITLFEDKLMGFSLAYCDNDETTSRENFIGSMIMSASNSNDNYKTADHFGSMLLVPENFEPVGIAASRTAEWKICPVPSSDYIQIEYSGKNDPTAQILISNMQGQEVYNGYLNNPAANIDLSSLDRGIYILNIRTFKGTFSRKIIKS